MRKWCSFILALAVSLLPGIANSQCRPEAIQPGDYKIRIKNADNTIWCLDRAPDDGTHEKLVFSTCDGNHPETEIFRVVDTGNANGCYQIRPKADDGPGTSYHLLWVGAANLGQDRWTRIISSPCSDIGGTCTQNFATWAIKPWGNGTFKILSNIAVEGYPQGFCMDKRDEDIGPINAPVPQFIDCRNIPIHQQFMFEPATVLSTPRPPGPSGFVCRRGRTGETLACTAAP